MKIKLLTVLSIAVFLLLGGCRSTNEANTNANMGANLNRATPMMTATPVMQTNESAATDPAMKANIESALKAKGFNNVTVDTSTNPATLRGTYPKGRLAEVIQTAQQANGGKPVLNQATEEN